MISIASYDGRTMDASPQRRRYGWPVLAVPVALALAAIAYVVATQAPPAPDASPIAVRDAGRAPIDPMAVAREAEARGELDVAIAAYQEAYKLTPAAEPLYRIADLEARIGNRMMAARYFHQYLDAAPAGPERDRVVARLATLEGGAGCTCVAGTMPACPRAQVPSCRCGQLCLAPPEGGACRSPTTSGTHGAACRGFIVATGAPATGTLACDYCPTLDLASLSGTDGAACTAFARDTGDRVDGVLRCGAR